MLQDDIAKTCIQLLLKEPFWGHLLAQIVRFPSEQIDTLGIQALPGQGFQLLVNESYWERKLNDPDTTTRHTFRMGAIKHQLLHLVFRHLWQVHEVKNKRLYGIAADLIVNQFLSDDQLQENAVTIEKFPDFDIPYNQTTRVVYSLLEGYYKNLTTQDDNLNSSEEYLLDLMTNDHLQIEEHILWEQLATLSGPAQKMIEDQLDKMLLASKQRTKPAQYNTLPRFLTSFIKIVEQNRNSTLDWRRVLRLFTTSSRKTYLKNTIRRPSKRYGTSPGISLKRKQRLLVALDTSGSIQNKELQLFFNELKMIWKAGAEILIIECDTIIHKEYPYKGTAPDAVMGRGGTGYDAALAYANEILPDAMIYFTDGLAPAPKEICRKPLIWLISPNGIEKGTGVWDELPGRKVRMMPVIPYKIIDFCLK